MLWMTGLVAPSAFRWGGFAAIDIVPRALSKWMRAAGARPALSCAVLAAALQHGYQHGFGGDAVKVKPNCPHASLLMCVALLLPVNLELILRAAARLPQPVWRTRQRLTARRRGITVSAGPPCST